MNLLKVCKGVHHETRFCLSVLFLAGSLFSTVLIVNNMPNTDPDFTTLSAAYTAAAPGDTLYIGGSTASYGDLTLTKPLTIIGTGYFLTQNPHTPGNRLRRSPGSTDL